MKKTDAPQIVSYVLGVIPGGGGGGYSPINYGLHVDVPLDRVWFLAPQCPEQGI